MLTARASVASGGIHPHGAAVAAVAVLVAAATTGSGATVAVGGTGNGSEVTVASSSGSIFRTAAPPRPSTITAASPTAAHVPAPMRRAGEGGRGGSGTRAAGSCRWGEAGAPPPEAARATSTA